MAFVADVEADQQGGDLLDDARVLKLSAVNGSHACDRDDSEPGGWPVAMAEAERKLAELPRRLEKPRKSGLPKLSRSDEDARFLRQRGGGTNGDTRERSRFRTIL